MAQQEEVVDTSTAAEPSPLRKKRIEEKQELAHLNDRFLDYIQQVRRMKDVNFRLESELQGVKEQLGKEAESVKQLYEAELSDARTLIDETAKEKARQQILSSKNAARVEELETEWVVGKMEKESERVDKGCTIEKKKLGSPYS